MQFYISILGFWNQSPMDTRDDRNFSYKLIIAELRDGRGRDGTEREGRKEVRMREGGELLPLKEVGGKAMMGKNI